MRYEVETEFNDDTGLVKLFKTLAAALAFAKRQQKKANVIGVVVYDLETSELV